MEKEPGKKTGKGGAREGSGRKAVSGMYTKTMRVPTVMEEEVLCLIDMYSNWLKSGKMEKGMAGAPLRNREKELSGQYRRYSSMRSRARKYTNRKKKINGSCPCSEQKHKTKVSRTCFVFEVLLTF